MTHVPLGELPEFVRNVRAVIALAARKDRATIVALQGELGAGKTTFVQQLARDVGIEGTVASPTYVLMKTYDFPAPRTERGEVRKFTKLVHIDAYRLENPKEFRTLKPEEFLTDPNCLVLVEWPERLGKELPEPDLLLKFSQGTERTDSRDIDMVQ